MPTLLAVDVGLRTGLALYGDDGRLRWYRSQHYGNRSKLRRGIYGLLHGEQELTHLVAEGGGDLVQIWMHEAGKRGVAARQVDAGEWRPTLLRPRDQRSGPRAKEAADTLARRVIAWSGAARPTSLRHDAAEAILVGLWGVLQVGWLDAVPTW
ncbi:MAG: hypothetical protein AAGI71_12535 [Bacteroidota bacterium]